MTKKLATSGEVQRLTGLSPDQLREWSNRRGLIKPDVQANGPGHKARYSWQTVLLLRLAMVLKTTFHVELQAQRELFARLAQQLKNRPFHSLRGLALIVQTTSLHEIVNLSKFCALDTDVLIIRLDPHLDALSAEFGLAEPTAQFPLFAVVAM